MLDPTLPSHQHGDGSQGRHSLETFRTTSNTPPLLVLDTHSDSDILLGASSYTLAGTLGRHSRAGVWVRKWRIVGWWSDFPGMAPMLDFWAAERASAPKGSAEVR
jgi:hypothetical protein